MGPMWTRTGSKSGIQAQHADRLRLVLADRPDLEVPEHESVRVQVGQEIRFSATGETKARRGYVARVSPALDKKSRVLIVEADVPNDGSLHPGAFVRAEIVVDLQAQAFTVPPTAIRTFAGLHKVVVATNGTALEKSVTVGARSTEWVEIVAGLAAGEKVAEDPGALRNGDAVTPQPAK